MGCDEGVWSADIVRSCIGGGSGPFRFGAEPILSERPFVFRGFLPGELGTVVQFVSGLGGGCPPTPNSSVDGRPEGFEAKEDKGTISMGDSGDDEGDGSVTEDESAVEMVVVGEDSLDPGADVDVLPR
jgi:hypothetical protein